MNGEWITDSPPTRLRSNPCYGHSALLCCLELRLLCRPQPVNRTSIRQAISRRVTRIATPHTMIPRTATRHLRTSRRRTSQTTATRQGIPGYGDPTDSMDNPTFTAEPTAPCDPVGTTDDPSCPSDPTGPFDPVGPTDDPSCPSDPTGPCDPVGPTDDPSCPGDPTGPCDP